MTTRSTPSAFTRVGGTLGALMTGVLARNSANANLATNLKKLRDGHLRSADSYGSNSKPSV